MTSFPLVLVVLLTRRCNGLGVLQFEMILPSGYLVARVILLLLLFQLCLLLSSPTLLLLLLRVTDLLKLLLIPCNELLRSRELEDVREPED